jgi:predicted GNAT family acetyltransferase
MTNVIHRPDAGRFEAVVDGQLSVADYEIEGRVMHMTHTGVPSALRGHGIAGALVKEALDYARAEGLKVNPLCSYVRVYMHRHPETLSLLASH